jgi:type II secretory pathway predicted ATPase ExeA
MQTYGRQFETPLSSIVMQGAALAVLALVLIAGVIVFERRRASRPPRRRPRRSRRRSSASSRVLAAPMIEERPAVVMPIAPVPVAVAEASPIESVPPETPPVELPVAGLSATDLPMTELPVAEIVVAEEPVVEVPLVAVAEAPPVPTLVVPGTGRRPSDPLRHWGLREPAFDNVPTTRFLYLSPEHKEALFRLRYAIQHRKGCAMLTGDYGCGKTTLARSIARELDPTRFDVALIANPLLTPIGFLQELLHQLGVTPAANSKPSLLRALETRLVENFRGGRDTVVIVDEAQLIGDDAVFNELRLLLNFQTNDRFLITLVLAGSDELLEALRRQPHLAQRCAVRASLVPLDREQTGHYVRHRLVTAGREATTLTEDAVDELYNATGGTPRVINAVCDLTLFVGAAAGVRCVDGDLVRRVAGDITAVAA